MITGVSVGLFADAYRLALLASRPQPVTTLPPSLDLGRDPPAVANLLVTG